MYLAWYCVIIADVVCVRCVQGACVWSVAAAVKAWRTHGWLVEVVCVMDGVCAWHVYAMVCGLVGYGIDRRRCVWVECVSNGIIFINSG